MSYRLSCQPNFWGCRDPQCGDSTWDHDCPVGAGKPPPARHLFRKSCLWPVLLACGHYRFISDGTYFSRTALCKVCPTGHRWWDSGREIKRRLVLTPL